jgi:DNA-binding transcriptional MocR family regulator
MNVWVPVPDETGAVARLLHAGWAVAPGARFRLAAPPGIRVTVSTLAGDEIETLADAIASAVGPAPARSYD